MTFSRFFRACVLAGALLSFVPPPVSAQEAGDSPWNDAAALALVDRGIERRMVEVVDTALQTYVADARGYVYFLLDAPELSRQSLVRTDQVAVQVYWRSPNEVRQRIVGLRERRELPVSRLYYYLDRLTVVQDNYGQSIVIADGDNVNDVPHPVAPGATGVYDYRVVDALTLRLPGVPDPVRVWEVQVRPKDPGVPALVGSIFLEEATGALVRMQFTFTPSAYVDPRLDFINVTLENGLWQGRYWLPHEQRLEIRRELPELDLPFGTIIRTRMRIGDYRFNEAVPEWLFTGFSPISVAPRDQRENFAFEQPIDAEWRLEGFGPPAEPEEIRREAEALLRQRALSGLGRTRPGAAALSDVARYNRAEGLAVGAGMGVRIAGDLQARVAAGWAFGPAHPTARLDFRGRRLQGSAHLNLRRDAGGAPAASGLTNTLGSLLFASDWTDPYYASGIGLAARAPVGGRWTLGAGGRVERQRSAAAVTDFSLFGGIFRPVRPIDDGVHVSAELSARRDPAFVSGGWWGEGRLGAGHLAADDGGAEGAGTFGRAELSGGFTWSGSADARAARLEAAATAGALFGGVPAQERYLVGGRGTLPGYIHRTFAGDRFARLSATASADLTRPWIRGRVLGGAGWVGGAREAVGWETTGSGGIRPSVGAGVGLFYDLLRVDVMRGFGRGARTELIIEVQPSFWGFL